MNLFKSTTIAFFTTLLVQNANSTTLTHNNKVIIAPSVSHNALIIKSTSTCNIKIVDENGNIKREKNCIRGTNEMDLKNIQSAHYKLIITNETSSTTRKLLIL